MPSKRTIDRARQDLRAGKRPSTAAGEFVREEIEHVREGKHGVRSTRQAIAIGLSKARRAGVPLKPPARGEVPAPTRKSAQRDYATGQGQRRRRAPSVKRARATTAALEREGRSGASRKALSRQARRTRRTRARGARKATRRGASN